MIDFACKRFKIDEIIKCGLGLTKVELDIFYVLIKQEDWIDSKQLSDILKRDNSTVQRALKKFNEQGLVLRKQINLDKGGYSFIYLPKNKTEIKSKIMSIINIWTSKVEDEFNIWERT